MYSTVNGKLKYKQKCSKKKEGFMLSILIDWISCSNVMWFSYGRHDTPEDRLIESSIYDVVSIIYSIDN